jgi:putative transposase
MIDREHPLPMTKQCHLLALSRSSVYYTPVLISDKDRERMRLIDEIHLEEPYLGSRGIKGALRIRGHKVGRIHVRTLMRRMGIEAVYRKPRLSKPHPGHTVYPYLLKGLAITEANAVWCSDITYLPMAKGFCYLVAVMDWASRKVLSWRLSNTLDPSFCIEALEEALRNYGTPGIFNTDQGSQFTADAFLRVLKDRHIKISMDGQGRWMDNIFIERLWKTVKYQEVYLKAYESLPHARKELTKFFDRYTTRRPHQGLNDRTPDEVYFSALPEERNAV